MIKSISLRYGLIAGVGIVAYFLLFYFISPKTMFSPWVSWSSLIIYLAGMWLGAKAFAQENPARANFRLLLRESFAIYLVANFVYYLFYYLLLDVIDPNLVNIQTEVGLEALERNADLIDPKQLAQLKAALENKELGIQLNDLFLAFGNSAILGFLLSLGLAGLINRTQIN